MKSNYVEDKKFIKISGFVNFIQNSNLVHIKEYILNELKKYNKSYASYEKITNLVSLYPETSDEVGSEVHQEKIYILQQLDIDEFDIVMSFEDLIVFIIQKYKY